MERGGESTGSSTRPPPASCSVGAKRWPSRPGSAWSHARTDVRFRRERTVTRKDTSMADATHDDPYLHLFAEPDDHIRRALATIDGRIDTDPFAFEWDCRQQLDISARTCITAGR